MKVLPIIVVLILAGCIKQTNLPEDIAAIKQLAEDWRGGWLAGDAERLLSLLSDEPVLIMSSEDPIIGKEAIRTLYQYVFENYTFTSDEN
ncbi:MAG: YybH family protein, partial [Planctomycetota bacterium]